MVNVLKLHHRPPCTHNSPMLQTVWLKAKAKLTLALALQTLWLKAKAKLTTSRRRSTRVLKKRGHLQTSCAVSIRHLGGKWHIRGSVSASAFQHHPRKTKKKNYKQTKGDGSIECLAEWWTGTSDEEGREKSMPSSPPPHPLPFTTSSLHLLLSVS